MGLSKRVSSWSVEEVLEWMQGYHPAKMDTLQKAIIKHAISGRVLLRLKDHHLELLGVEAEEQQQEILQDVLLLKVQEEVNELNDICSGQLSSCDSDLASRVSNRPAESQPPPAPLPQSFSICQTQQPLSVTFW